MCGHVGVAGNLFQGDIKVFNELLYCDMLRGNHATGVASVRGKNTSVLKRAWTPEQLMQHKDYNSLVSATADVLIGHNRHGTMGANGNSLNAHPFNFENIVGAHNGTLDRSCVKGLYQAAQFDTDSEALYSEINQNGVDEAFTKIEGAWALVYYDKRSNELNMIRNEQRPLFYAYKKGRTVLYWASEQYLLHWVLSRNKVELEDGYFIVDENMLHTWSVGRVMPEPELRPLAATYTPMWKRPNYKWDALISDWRKKTEAEIEEDKTKAASRLASGGTSNNAPFRGSIQAPTKGTQTGATGATTTAEVIELHGSKETLTGKSTTSGDTEVTSQVFQARRFRREQISKFGSNTYAHKGQRIGEIRFKHIMELSCCAYCGNDDIQFGDPVFFLDSTTGQGWPEFLCEHCLAKPEIADLSSEAARQGKFICD